MGLFSVLPLQNTPSGPKIKVPTCIENGKWFFESFQHPFETGREVAGPI
jgi:hypothetical protein